PSARLSTLNDKLTTVAAQRRTDPRHLLRTVKGDLDWIVMKALDKDRNRRYETARAFEADVQRYLHDKPVQACPPSPWYCFRKFGRRHKMGLAVAGLVLFFVVVLAGGAGWTLRDQAVRKAALGRKVSEAADEARKLLADDLLYEAKTAAKRAKD